MSQTSISRIVLETCAAVWNALQQEVMPTPDLAAWKKIALDFEYLWIFPHCLGAIDGKHVLLQAPANSGSLYFNYKKTFSLVLSLMAVVDAQYNFVVVDIGAYGRQSDGNVFANSLFGKKLKNLQLPLPAEEPLTATSEPQLPYVFVGDEAFPLVLIVMRPYTGSVVIGNPERHERKASHCGSKQQ